EFVQKRMARRAVQTLIEVVCQNPWSQTPELMLLVDRTSTREACLRERRTPTVVVLWESGRKVQRQELQAPRRMWTVSRSRNTAWCVPTSSPARFRRSDT